MSDTTPEESEPKSKSLKTLLDVSLTTALVTAPDSIDFAKGYQWVPKLMTIFGPALGLIISQILVYYLNEWQDKQSEKKIKEYMVDLEKQLTSTSLDALTQKRCQEESALYNEDLIAIRRRRSKRKMLR